MHYWIDGYNLLFRLPLSKGSFQKKRESIIIELNAQVKILNLQLTVVFDSCSPDNDPIRRSHYDALEIVYTAPSVSADDLLLCIAQNTEDPNRLCIVTSDLALAKKIKASRIRTLSLESFLDMLSKKQKKKEELKADKDYVESSFETKRLLAIFEKKLHTKDL